MKLFRWKGIIPFVIITAVIYIFTVYYLDGYLRRALVKQGTKINGALVDVDSLRLSFMKSRLTIRGLRATDPENLMRNRLEIPAITADFRFLPLLKKRVVIEKMQVADVQWATPRTKPGAIPAAWKRQWEEEEREAKNSLFAKAFESVKSQVMTQLPDVDVDSLAEKFDPATFVKLDEIASYQQAKALPDEVTTFADDWKKKASGFVDDQKQRLADYQTKIESLDPKKIKAPQDILNAIETIQSFEKDVNAHKDSISNLSDDAKKAVAEKVQRVKALRASFEDDVDRLKNKIGFGDLDIRNLSQSIFGSLTLDRYAKYMVHYKKLRAVMASLKGKEEPKRQRSRGRDIPFPITDNTPRFLLAALDLSADTKTNTSVDKEFRGHYFLAGRSITSDPILWGKPMTLKLGADMVDAGFKRAELTAMIDRTQENASHDQFSADVDGVKLGTTTIAEGSIFPIPLKQGWVDFDANVDLKDDRIAAEVKAQLKQLDYAFPPQQNMPPLKEILQDVIGTLHQFDVYAGFKGNFEAPDFTLRSSFDDQLLAGIQKVLLAKLDKARRELEAYLRKEIGAQIAVGEKLLDAKKGEVMGLINKQLKSVTDLEKMADKKLNELKKQQTKLLGKELSDKLPGGIKTPKLPKADIKLPGGKKGSSPTKDLKKQLGF